MALATSGPCAGGEATLAEVVKLQDQVKEVTTGSKTLADGGRGDSHRSGERSNQRVTDHRGLTCASLNLCAP
jgi:X-X-X-Leu-X-X-Gly heptad repeat protein